MPILFPTTSLKRATTFTKDIRHPREDKRDYSQTYKYLLLLAPPREPHEHGYQPVLPDKLLEILEPMFVEAFDGVGDHPERGPLVEFKRHRASVESPCLELLVEVKISYTKPSLIPHKWYPEIEEVLREKLEDVAFWEPMFPSDVQQLQRIEALLEALRALDIVPSLRGAYPRQCFPAPYDVLDSTYTAIHLDKTIRISFDEDRMGSNYVKIFNDPTGDYRKKTSSYADSEPIYHPSGVVAACAKITDAYYNSEGSRVYGMRGGVAHVKAYLEDQVERVKKMERAKYVAATLIKEAGSIPHLHRLIYLGKIRKVRDAWKYKYAA